MIRALLIGILSAGALAACATTAPARHQARTAAVAPGCLKTTGSLIPPGKHGCAGYGRSYSQRDLRQTGHVDNLARSLQMLDPAITAVGPN